MTRGSGSPLGSLHSSQDSLHKHSSKKKGLKSSLGRFFSKKEKQKSKEAYAREMAAGKKHNLTTHFSCCCLTVVRTVVSRGVVLCSSQLLVPPLAS